MKCKAFITAQQVQILELLIARAVVHRDQLIAVLYENDPRGGPDAASRVIQAQLCKLRRTLKPYGVEIVTSDIYSPFGGRYYMTADNKERARNILAIRDSLAHSRTIGQLELFAHAR